MLKVGSTLVLNGEGTLESFVFKGFRTGWETFPEGGWTPSLSTDTEVTYVRVVYVLRPSQYRKGERVSTLL